MSVSIRGHVTGPTGKPVSVALSATPVPNPSRTQAGDIIVGGLLADAQDGNIDTSLTPGRYVLTVMSASAAILAEREVQLVDGQVMKIGELLSPGSQPTPTPQPGGTVIVDADGHPVALASIKIVHSTGEAEALADGEIYLLAADVPSPGPAPVAAPTVIAHAAGHAAGDRITVTAAGGQAGDRVILILNVKGSDAEFTAPTGWDTLLQPYYQGTMRFVIMTGGWAETMEVTTSKPVTGSWAAVVVRGGGQPVVGAVKKRNEEPTETVTVTAPVVETEGLALAVACERTSANETDEQISVSAGWEKIVSALQDGEAWETIVVAKRVAPGSDQSIFTYPNAQATNGCGVQVVIPK
jgi:hypothetical protein|nr:MAG TPA: hypothetical protein [Caudoviricetes sp.]